MKSIHGLFILLIGMISLTAFGATSEPTQKQKPRIDAVQHFDFVQDVAVTAFDYESNAIAEVPVISSSSDAFYHFETVVQPLAIITDVGWTSIDNPNYNYNGDKLQDFNFSNMNKGPNCYRCACCTKCG